MQYDENTNWFDDDSEHGPAEDGGESTPDADYVIKIGDWIDIRSPKPNKNTAKAVGMGFMTQGPGVTLGIGTFAEAPVWVTISVVAIQVIGLVTASVLYRLRG